MITFAVLNTVRPVTFVVAAIYPVHVSIAVSRVCFIVSFVGIACGPFEYTVAPFFIVFVGSLVCVGVANASLPKSFPIS